MRSTAIDCWTKCGAGRPSLTTAQWIPISPTCERRSSPKVASHASWLEYVEWVTASTADLPALKSLTQSLRNPDTTNITITSALGVSSDPLGLGGPVMKRKGFKSAAAAGSLLLALALSGVAVIKARATASSGLTNTPLARGTSASNGTIPLQVGTDVAMV